MIKPTKKGLVLTQAVLASSLFVTPLVHANTVIHGAATQQQTLGADNNTIQVAFDGKIVDALPTVLINSIGGTLLVDPGNFFGPGALAVNSTAAEGVLVSMPNGVINVGAGSGITSDVDDGIFVDATGLTISNKGTVQGLLSAVHYSKNGTNGTLNNAGILQNLAGATEATILTDAGGSGFTLNNTGTVSQSIADENVIELNANFNMITNSAPGLITHSGDGLGSVILIGGGVTAGSIVNDNGDITLTHEDSTGNAIFFDNAGVGAGTTLSLTNQNSGDIISVNNAAVFVLGDIDSINNTGLATIQSTSLDGGGLGNNAVIELGAFTIFNGLNNSGFITNLAPTPGLTFAIDLAAGKATFNQSGGVVTGDVRLAESDPAVGGNVFNMTGGVIAGNVTAANVVKNILNLNGGAITGTMQLGTKGDTLNLGWDAVNNVPATTGGTNANFILGAGPDEIFNIAGGSFNALIGGAGVINTINFNGTFTQNGTIEDVDFINVGNGFANVVLTSNGNISELTGPLVVNAGGTMIANANITMGIDGAVVVQGAAGGLPRGVFIANLNPIIDFSAAGGGEIFSNSGITQIGPNGSLTLIDEPGGTAGLFTNEENGFFIPQIGGIVVPGGAVTNGQLIVISEADNAVNFLNAPNYVAPTFTGFVPNNSLFNVVVVNGGGDITPLAANAPVFVPFSSAVVSYTASLVMGDVADSVLQLKASRNTYTSLAGNNPTLGVAGALDVLAQGNGPTNQTLLSLLAQLDQLPTAGQVSDSMESLSPPHNYGIPRGARVGMEILFEGVHDRINELHEWKVNTEPRRLPRRHRHVSNDQPFQVAQNGVSFGDPAGVAGVWGKVLGAHLDQDERDNVEGYKVNAAGGALGADWGVNDCFTIGLAASYTKANVDDKFVYPKDSSIKSWQGTAYTWLEFTHCLFLDAMLAYAGHDIHSNRVIGVNQIFTAAQSSYDGHQWGAQTDLVWRVVNDGSLYFAPFARLKWTHLDLDDYTETGAGDLNLTVANSDLNEFMGGLGFRLGSRWHSGNICWVPELSAMIGYDFENDGEQSIGAFGGAPDLAFTTNGVEPGRTMFNLGLGLNANVSACSTFTIKYNLELRDDFVGNSGYLQYYYLWG